MKYLYQTKWPQWIKRPRRGFSFTEVITTVGIMGLLAAIATPMYLGYRQDALINKMKTDSNTVRNKIAMCFKYAELHDCVDANSDGNCDLTERSNARWEACYPSSGPDANISGRMKKLGLIPCSGGAMAVSTACDNLQGNASSKLLCVTLQWKEQQACVRYDASGSQFKVCADPEDPANLDTTNPNRCDATCDPKKGYKCDGSLQCVCA